MIRATLTVESVDATVAGNVVIQFIPYSVEICGPRQREMLDIRTEGKAHGAFCPIRRLVRPLNDLIAQIVDNVEIAVGSAQHRIGFGPTIQPVDARIALEVVALPTAFEQIAAPTPIEMIGFAIPDEYTNVFI